MAKFKNRSSERLIQICYGGMIAALYVVLTLVSAAFGLSSGVIQVRISEALCVLCVFMPSAVWGLTVGCLIANTVTEAVPIDIFFGAVATLIGAAGAYLLPKIPRLRRIGVWLAPLPTVLANAAILPFVLRYAYNIGDSMYFMAVTVAIGEFVSAAVMGTFLRIALERTLFRRKEI